MIKVTDLSKNYGPVEAVKSISFEIKDGEIVGFLGANGAGKNNYAQNDYGVFGTNRRKN